MTWDFKGLDVLKDDAKKIEYQIGLLKKQISNLRKDLKAINKCVTYLTKGPNLKKRIKKNENTNIKDTLPEKEQKLDTQ